MAAATAVQENTVEATGQAQASQTRLDANAEKAAEQMEKYKAIASQTVNDIVSVNADKDKATVELHQHYATFGQDKLDPYMPDEKQSIQFDVTMRDMESGSAATKEVASVLSDMHGSMMNLKPSKVPQNKFLNKILDPLGRYITRARKTGSILQDCIKALASADKTLAVEIDKYLKERERASKLAAVANEQAQIAECTADELEAKLKQMEEDGVDQNTILVYKSDILATLRRRSGDLYALANVNARYVMGLNILINGHEQAREEIFRAKNVSVVEFTNAVNLAVGVNSEQEVMAMSKVIREDAQKLNVSTAENMKSSQENIMDSRKKMMVDVETIKHATDIMCSTIDEMRRNEADSADELAKQVTQMKESVSYMNKRIAETQAMEDQRQRALATISKAMDEGEAR